MRPPCAPPGKPRPAIQPGIERGRMRHRDEGAMGLYSAFPGRSWPGRAAETLVNAREICRKLCPAQAMRPTNPFRPAIVARPRNDRVATQDEEQVDIAANSGGRSLHGGFAEIIRNSWESQQKAQGRKINSRIGTPSGAKSPAKRRFPGSKTGPSCMKRASKRPKRKPGSRVPLRRRWGCRVLGMPFPGGSK